MEGDVPKIGDFGLCSLLRDPTSFENEPHLVTDSSVRRGNDGQFFVLYSDES